MIKLIGIDIDGTVLPHPGKIHDRTKDALHKAIKDGYHVSIVTGRNVTTIYPIIQQLELQDKEFYIGAQNGGQVHKANFCKTRRRCKTALEELTFAEFKITTVMPSPTRAYEGIKYDVTVEANEGYILENFDGNVQITLQVGKDDIVLSKKYIEEQINTKMAGQTFAKPEDGSVY
ncbi:hypothetical protein FQA39_LY12920 [Lamprigera yunnana]|nr:hypothetical protein FQA39_LY12920 [Lamprigera yunnana]